MARRARNAVLGGTFDRLHAGHRALLDAAFRSADRVGIGLTTDAFLRRHPKPRAASIRTYALRRRALVRYLRKSFRGRSYWVVPLSDPLGGSVAPEVDVLVVSAETRDGAGAVNRERARRHLPRLKVVVVAVQRGADLRPIAGRRIREGDIDERGHRLRPVRIGLSSPRTWAPGLEAAVRRTLGGSSIVWIVHPGPPRATATPAAERALRAARRNLRGAEYGLCLIADRSGRKVATLGAWDPEGPVAAVRGSLSGPQPFDRLVRRLFRGRRVSRWSRASRDGDAAPRLR